MKKFTLFILSVGLLACGTDKEPEEIVATIVEEENPLATLQEARRGIKAYCAVYDERGFENPEILWDECHKQAKASKLLVSESSYPRPATELTTASMPFMWGFTNTTGKIVPVSLVITSTVGCEGICYADSLTVPTNDWFIAGSAPFNPKYLGITTKQLIMFYRHSNDTTDPTPLAAIRFVNYPKE